MFKAFHLFVLCFLFSGSADCVYHSPDLITTDRLTLKRVVSVDQDIECYNALHADAGSKATWFMGFTAYDPKKTGDEILRGMARLGRYSQQLSFTPYLIYKTEGNEFLGRFSFHDHENSRLETSIYILRAHQAQGYGTEAMKAIFENCILPAIGSDYTIYKIRSHVLEPFQGFEGIYGDCAPWHNWASLSSHLKAGCLFSIRKKVGLDVVNGRLKNVAELLTPFFYYPRGVEHVMDKEDNDALKKLYELLQDYLHKYQPESSSQLFCILGVFGGDDKEALKQAAFDLLKTKDPQTRATMVELLEMIFVDESEIKAALSLADQALDEDTEDVDNSAKRRRLK